MREPDAAVLRVWEHSGHVLLRTGPDLVVSWASEATGTAWGWQAAAVVGARLEDLVHPDDRGALARPEATGPAPATVRVRVRTHDGGYRWSRVTVEPVTEADERPDGAVVALADIEELVAAEQELAAQRALLRETLDAEADPHVRFVPVRDENGTIVDFLYAEANAAACAYDGMAHDELVGTSLLRLLPGHVSSGLLQQYSMVMDTGEPLLLQDFAYEQELRGGQERRYDIRVVKVGDGLSYSWRDVTERYEAEQALAAEQEQFRSAMDAAAIGICLVAPDGGFLRVNPALCELLGRDEETLKACTWQELTHPDDLDVDLGLVADVLAGRRDHYRLRKRYLRPDGTVVHAELAVSCVRDRDGQVRHFVSQIVDMTTEHEQRLALEATQEQYRLLAENATDVVFRANARGVLTYCSEGVTRVLGWTPDQVVGRRDLDFVHPDDVITAQSPPLGPERDLFGPYRVRMRTTLGGYRWIEITAKNLRDDDDRITGRVGGWRDATAEVTAEQALIRQASIDGLTGLLNRTEVLARLDAILRHPPRTGTALALAFVDLDGLKEVNDARGHAAGDLLLQESAARISAVVREGDLVARIGGDEVLVLLHGVHDIRDAVAIAEKIRVAVSQPITPDTGLPLATTASIGVTLAREDDTMDAVIARADKAMYEAKRLGGNRVHVGR